VAGSFRPLDHWSTGALDHSILFPADLTLPESGVSYSRWIPDSPGLDGSGRYGKCSCYPWKLTITDHQTDALVCELYGLTAE